MDKPDPIGRLKESEHGKMESLAFDMLTALFSDQTNSRVIDARHKFAKKRYFTNSAGNRLMKSSFQLQRPYSENIFSNDLRSSND